MTTATRSEAIEGALWMTATMALAAAMTALIRFGAADMHPFEVAFFRAVFGVLFLLPWHAASGTWRLPSRMFPLHLLRAVFTVACMLAFFWAVTLMPIAEATALSFTTPLIATMGAAVFLKEHVGRRRWMGVAVGFAGVLLILRPGFESLSFGAVLVLFSAVTGAGDWLTLRPLARRNPTRVVVTWLTLLMVPLSLVPALVFWTRPSVEGLLWTAALAAAATLGQLTATRAFACTDVSYLALFDFLRLVFVAVIGIALFGEAVDAWTMLGAAVIVLASARLARQEAKRPGN